MIRRQGKKNTGFQNIVEARQHVYYLYIRKIITGKTSFEVELFLHNLKDRLSFKIRKVYFTMRRGYYVCQARGLLAARQVCLKVLIILGQGSLGGLLGVLLNLGQPLRIHDNLGRLERRGSNELQVRVTDQLPKKGI